MATVILLSADSTVVSTTLSSDGGTFELSGEGAHWLQVNHLAYQTLRVSLDAPLPDVLYMDQATGELGEVVVKAERPLMKLVDGTTPSYDIDQLFAHSSVTTAYEMLGQLPGMSMQDDVPTLVGTIPWSSMVSPRMSLRRCCSSVSRAFPERWCLVWRSPILPLLAIELRALRSM